jgi:hypothetical protein
MNALYVFQANGQPTGPFTTEALARAIVDGAMPRDAFVAPVGASQWLHASQVPEVNAFVDAMMRARSTPPPPMVAKVQPPAPTEPQLQPPVQVPVQQAPQSQQAPQVQQAPQPQQTKPAADAKPTEDKPKAKPWPKWLPLAIFGCFATLALAEVAVALVVAPKAETTEAQPPGLAK